MTGEEAKTKWCPLIRLVAETDRTHPMNNREEVIGSMPEGGVSRCIASACMAWRMFPAEVSVQNTIGPAREPFIGLARDYADNQAWELTPLPRHGFCGLAGQPQ